MLHFLTSERSKPKLTHEGYIYQYKSQKTDGDITWRCERNNKHHRDKGMGCSALASTSGTSPSSILRWARDHTHPPNSSKVKAKVICQEAKERATAEPTATPHLIMTDSLISATPDVNLSLPQPGSLKRNILRKRQAAALEATPDLATANDRSLTDLRIPESLYQPFKIFDSGPGDDRIIMFTTDANLALMRESMRLAGDGTFKVTPTLWYQIYTIHATKNGYTVPCVYALLPDKHKDTYNRLFTQLKAWLEPVATLQFSHFLADFEKGAYQAVVECFPGVDIEGCFFHLCKRLDFHVKKLGLSAKYQADIDFKLRVKKLAALAFLPVADVVAAYEALADEFEDDELPLLAYFEPTWIGSPVGRRGRRTPPIFPLSMWNVVGRHFTGTTRTTNALESFHHAINSLLTCKHPTIWVLLKALHRQQALTNNTLAQIARGETKRLVAAQKARNARITTLVSNYSNTDTDKTLRGVAYNYMY